MSDKKKTKHGLYQADCLTDHKKSMGAHSRATLSDIIIGLAFKGLYEQAAELLFACSREEVMALPGRGAPTVFLIFCRAENVELLKLAATRHTWQTTATQAPRPIQVYPGEFLVFSEEVEEKLEKIHPGMTL